MSNKIQVLKQTKLCGRQFNVYGTPEEPLFKAQDVAESLSLTNVSDMISRVDVEEVTKLNLFQYNYCAIKGYLHIVINKTPIDVSIQLLCD